MEQILDLDALLDQPIKARVKLGGKEYDLIQPGTVEDFLLLTAMGEKSQALMQESSPSVELVQESIDEIKTRMRRIIRLVVPGITDEDLQVACPDLAMLQRVMVVVLTAMRGALPETVKKNCGTSPSDATGPETESQTSSD